MTEESEMWKLFYERLTTVNHKREVYFFMRYKISQIYGIANKTFIQQRS